MTISTGDIIAFFALIASIYAIYQNYKTNQRQAGLLEMEKELNRFLIKKEQDELDSRLRTDIKGRYFKLGSNQYRLKLWNDGFANAKNITLSFKDNENILKKPILYILVVVVIGAIYISINLGDRNNVELPAYSESLELGAKQSLVPNDFPLPQGVDFEQEFERSYAGTISYTALWQTSSESRDVIKARYIEVS